MVRHLGLAALVLALSAGAVAANDLAARDIQRDLVGPSIRWSDEDAWLSGDLQLSPDGKASITSENPVAADEGHWRLVGDQLCTTWSRTRGGTEKCYRIRQVAARRYVTTGGNVFEIVEPGA